MYSLPNMFYVLLSSTELIDSTLIFTIDAHLFFSFSFNYHCSLLSIFIPSCHFYLPLLSSQSVTSALLSLSPSLLCNPLLFSHLEYGRKDKAGKTSQLIGKNLHEVAPNLGNASGFGSANCLLSQVVTQPLSLQKPEV